MGLRDSHVRGMLEGRPFIYPLGVKVLFHCEAIHHTRGGETALNAAQHQRKHGNLSAAHPERKECMVVTCVVKRVNGLALHSCLKDEGLGLDNNTGIT